MTTEIQNLDNLNFDEIAALTGAQVRETIVIPQLRVNREPEDEEGNKLPMGHFTVSQGEMRAFGQTALFRPFINSYQYIEYSPEEEKYTNRSIIFKSFNEEAFDEKGGLSCGKVPFKKLNECSPEEQLRQKNIKCRRHLYGLVTFPDSDILEVPVLWRLAGTAFLAPDIALKSITKIKHQFFQHQLDCKTKREKKGSTTYYSILIDPILKEEVRFTEDNYETFKMFQEAINRENSFILKSWREANKMQLKGSEPDYLKDLELDDPIPELA